MFTSQPYLSAIQYRFGPSALKIRTLLLSDTILAIFVRMFEVVYSFLGVKRVPRTLKSITFMFSACFIALRYDLINRNQQFCNFFNLSKLILLIKLMLG